MPILKNAKTVWVGDEPWESPDGKVTIWQIKLEVDGERDTHNTMSKALATMGFDGDVEVYTNAKGKDYVRQAPKEDGQPHPSGETSFKADPIKQDNIHRSVALENAIRYWRGKTTVGKVSESHILETADQFYTWLKGQPTTEDEQPSGYDKAKQQRDKIVEMPDDEPIDMPEDFLREEG